MELNDVQIENWRQYLSMILGPYAFLMPKEEVQKIYESMQEKINKEDEHDDIIDKK